MSDGSEKPQAGTTKSWNYWQAKTSDRPESTGGVLSLYIAIVAAIAVYYMFS